VILQAADAAPATLYPYPAPAPASAFIPAASPGSADTERHPDSVLRAIGATLGGNLR